MKQQESFSSNKPYLFRAIYEWLLDNNATPYVLVDASLPNVEVPVEHIQNGQIVLNASPSAIRDWIVDNQAVSFSARFSGKSRHIYVPMNAILAIYAQENGLGMAFPSVEESETAELESELETEAEESALAEASESQPEETSTFKPEIVETNSNDKAEVRDKSRSNSHLKVIK